MSSSAFILPVASAASAQDRDIHVPSTISPQAQATLGNFGPYLVVPAVGDNEPWAALQGMIAQGGKAGAGKIIEDNEVSVVEVSLGGVPVLEITSKNWTDDGKVVVYTHGGAYTPNSVPP